MRAVPARAAARTAAVVALLVVAAIVLWRTRSDPAAPGSPPPVRPTTVVIVTIDTLRADRVGAYGWSAARTPAMDGLAARGARFDRAYATAPLTLPSHASLFTGLYPPGHASRNNGMRIQASAVTLADRLRASGWATGAFVGAFPLDRRFGLDRGFDTYGDRMPRGPNGRPLNERPGRMVVDEALAWLRSQGDRPVFLWVHLFEPHAPYVPDPARGPAGARLPPSERYDDEVAAADREVGRLLAALRGRPTEPLVVAAGDHGEAFGEHGEVTHSVFLYDTTLRVPLIVAGPGIVPSIPPDPAGLVDVLPTIIDVLGLPPSDVDGVSLVPAFRGAALPVRDLYAETFAPYLDFGWSALRSVRVGALKLVDAPRPELFDTAADPGETADLADARPDDVRRLTARLGRYGAAELPRVSEPGIDADTKTRLGALGYVTGAGSGDASGARPDPKDRRELAARLALAFSDELTGEPLRAALLELAAAEPANVQVRARLGAVLLEAGDCRKAEPHLRAAIAGGIVSADPYLGLAWCYTRSGRVREAERTLTDGARVEPGNPVILANLGEIALAGGRLDEAQARLQEAVSADPDLHQARFTLARTLARAGRRDAAREQADELLARLPADAPQRGEVQRLIRALQ